MIDIHSHLLYEVDDGAKSYKESVEMLRAARAQGVYAMILTPHYRRGMFAFPKETVVAHFERLKSMAKAIGVQIFLGTECHVNSQLVEYIKSGRCLTLAGSNYVLVEYKSDVEFSFIRNTVDELLMEGYIPIVAHVERYNCMQDGVKLVQELRQKGAMMQVNADAVLGIDGRDVKQYVKKLLTNHWVDFVASDSHDLRRRANHMGKCSEYLYRKYEKNYVDDILENNALKILQAAKKWE